ncbi:MAG: hypothetical protein GY801_28510 [bacterium]|nr:hypothetical protein [bacterium]
MMVREINMKGYIGVGIAIVAMMGLIGCELFDLGEVTNVTAPAGVSELSNFIMGDPEIAEWGAQYAEDNSYTMVNIPVSGALQVEYGLVDGGTFALFLETTQPVELEIGLKSQEVTTTAKSVVDALEWVCVTYEEGTTFASTPANIEKNIQNAWTHYQRVDETDTVHPWWLQGVDFVFSGATQQMCVIENQTVMVTEVSGPFPKPQSTTPFTLTSIAVSGGELLDAYKCDKTPDLDNSIPLAWSGVPASAGSLAIIMHHYPDYPDTSTVSAYLLLWGIDPSVTAIPYSTADDGPWYLGANKDGAGPGPAYSSPCSIGVGTHEYTITLYALSEMPASLPAYSTKNVTYGVLKDAIATVTTIDTATLTFDSVTP